MLIEDYIYIAIRLNDLNTPYLSKKNVDKNNKLSKKIREIAVEISRGNNELRTEFAHLINHENANVRLWCAHHILELFDYDEETQGLAINEIEKQAEKNFGERLWLKKWQDKQSSKNSSGL